jgi:D-alanine--poly(phosphoribitol) ligase subunit 1
MMSLKNTLKAHLSDESTCESIAYIQGDERFTYGQIFRQAACLRAKLGTERGNPVLVCGHKEPGMLAGFLACMAAGRPFVPVDQSLPAARIRQIAEITEAQHAIVCNDRVPVAGVTVINGRLPEQSPRELSGKPENQADYDTLFDDTVAGLDTAYIIFTSGTTGEPKGVKIPMEALDDFLDWTVNSLFPFPPTKKVWMNHAILSFDLSVFEIWNSIATGGTIVALDSASNRNIRAAFRDLADNNAQIWVSTPSYADLCLLDRRFSDETIPTLEDFVFCGEVLGHRTAQSLKERFPRARVWNLYGPTEATCATTGIEITSEILRTHNALPVGQVKPGTQIHLDEGEIVISGINVSTGYMNRPELTAEKFFETDNLRSYRTGDLGKFDASGTLFCLGRADSQIKLNGYRIELDEIENTIRALAGVDSAACVDLRNDDKVTAIACSYCGDQQDESKLKKSLERELPAYMVPSRFLHLDELPLNINGKIDRQAIRRLFA